jgi:hypothetical protein
MARYQPSVCTLRLVGLVLLVITPSQLVAQAQLGGQPPLSVVVAEQTWSAPFQAWQPNVSDSVHESRADRSAARTIAIHTVVGTGAGLLLGLVLSGASAGDDQTSVVLTWTALGAAAGVVSGIVTWLVGRPL